MARFWGPLYPFLKIFALLYALLSVARFSHSLIFSSHLNGTGDLARIFLNGLRIDALLISTLFILPVILYTSLHTFFSSATRRSKPIFIYWTILAILLVVFFELITPWYMFEYGTRPETKFFEYLDSPREVLLMLWGMFGLLIPAIIAVLALAAALTYRMVCKCFSTHESWRAARFLVIFPLVIGLMTLGIRSSLDHRPVNPGSVAFTDDTIVNSLPLNSLYSVLYAAYRIKDEAAASEIYGNLPEKEIMRRVAREQAMHNPGALLPVSARASNSQAKNLVIILEESLGARFVGKLGGVALTPNLDRFASEGWWFRHMYATGTRSVRGIEAVVSGFLPTPGRSVVKLPNSQSGFFTLASHLRQFGYLSQFYYGGNAQFDNMKGFFLGNGFHDVVEQDDFINPKFVGSWGASDQDVFERIHRDLLKDPTTPKLSVVLTTSNHTPFDFPADVDASFEVPRKSRENAIRYADAALGEFIAKARQSDYWEQTIFLVVADHDRKVSDFVMAGDLDDTEKSQNYFPVEGFRIPALILGGSIEPRNIDYIASQIDMAPTLLGLIGVNAPNPMPGTDLTRVGDSYEGRAIMQYNDLQAYLDGDRLVVLRPEQAPLKGNYRNSKFTPATNNRIDDLAKTALAHALWASTSYRDGTYN